MSGEGVKEAARTASEQRHGDATKGSGTGLVGKFAAVGATQALTLALSLLLALVMPRHVGPEGMGSYQLANMVWTLVVTLCAFGSAPVLVREIARHPGSAGTLTRMTVFARLALFLPVGVVAIAVCRAFVEDTAHFDLLLVLGVAYGIQLVGTVFEASLQGQHRMQATSLAITAGRVVFTLGALALLLRGGDVLSVGMAMIVGNVLHAVLCLVLLSRQVGEGTFEAEGDGDSGPYRPAPFRLAREGATFLGGALLLTVYQQSSVYLIAWLLSAAAVGWFGVAWNLFGTLLFLPTIITNVMFPLAARAHSVSEASFVRLARRTLDAVILTSVPIGIGAFVLARPFVHLVYGDRFTPTGPVLAVFGLCVIPVFLTTVIGSLLSSMDRQVVWLKLLVVALAAKLLLEIALIQACASYLDNGALGPAIAILLVESAMAVIGLRLLPPGTIDGDTIRRSVKVGACGLAMGLIVHMVSDRMLLVPILAGAVVYCACILALRALPSEVAEALGMSRIAARLRPGG